MARHPNSCIFHTGEWLRALQQSYQYTPVAFTTSLPDEPLKNGIVLCEVKSWATGRRLVSLPFSDHGEPLVDNADDFFEILQHLSGLGRNAGWKYIELRPRLKTDALDGVLERNGFGTSARFWSHTLDLRDELENIVRRLHPDCIRRKVRRAERDGLLYERGRTKKLLQQFYLLLIRTRRRHFVPPQPIEWFENLLACLGENAEIRVASKGSTPIAAILTLTFRDTIVYKYGCSDERFHKLGAMPLLFWRAIHEAKEAGFREFDLGRSDCDNAGLVAFKEHLGASRKLLTYFRYPAKPSSNQDGCLPGLKKWVYPYLPDFLLRVAGRIAYRHVG